MKNWNEKINSLILLSGVLVFTAGSIMIANVGNTTIAYMNALINGLTILV